MSSSFNYREQMEIISAHSIKINQLYNECAKLYGLSYNLMIILETLRQSQPCTQKQISEQCGLPKQSVNTIIKDLQGKQLIEFAAGRNKKEKLVMFTKAGKEYADMAIEPIKAIEESVLKQIGQEYCEKLVITTTKFSELFEKAVMSHQTNED